MVLATKINLNIAREVKFCYSFGNNTMSRDLRRYARQTTTRLIVGAILLLFVVGDGLIYVIYGRNAALMGIMCLILGLSPLLLIGLALWVIGWVARRANRD